MIPEIITDQAAILNKAYPEDLENLENDIITTFCKPYKAEKNFNIEKDCGTTIIYLVHSCLTRVKNYLRSTS